MATGRPAVWVTRRKALLPSLASVGYVALVALRGAPRVDLSAAFACAAALALAYVACRAAAKPLAWACWGAGLVVAALSARVTPAGALAVAVAIGSATACAAALVAVQAIATPGGILRVRPRSARAGVALLGVMWAPTVVSIVTDQRIAPTFVAISASASALILAGFAAALRLERRLELGVAERLSGFLLLAVALSVSAVALVLLGALAPAAAAGLLAAAFGVALSTYARLGDPVELWRAARRATLVLLFGVSLSSLIGVFIVEAASSNAARGALVVVTLVSLGVGAHIGKIEDSLDAERSRRLQALRTAIVAVRGRDAEQALLEVLRALRAVAPPPSLAPGGARAPSSELWLLDPVRSLRVDAAGYPHDEPAELPPELLAVACGEPEVTLRAEALEALEVRRPDLRPLSQWMKDAKVATATVVARGGEPEAILFLPAYGGEPHLSLEEARAVRALADELAPLCHARALLARSMDRERAASQAAERAEGRVELLEHALARASAHHALAATRLARPAAVGIYSAGSRLAYDALERLTKSQAPIAVVARSGVDPVPFLARAHLAGARAAAPLVLVDGTSTRDHDSGRWKDPVASPLALADGGMLVLLDGAALPADVQRLIGQALAERRAPWGRPEPLDVVLALTAVADPSRLVESGRLDPMLAARLGDAVEAPVRLPGIAERPEDIRALVTDRLAREGLRVRGAPVGIDDAAFMLLVEHGWDGEDAELGVVVQRLVASAAGEVVREPDVRRVLWGGAAGEPDGVTATARLSRKRPA